MRWDPYVKNCNVPQVKWDLIDRIFAPQAVRAKLKQVLKKQDTSGEDKAD